MKWFTQFILSPLIAATLAIWGNYQFVHKDEMKKEYTKIGIDILLRENAPETVKALGKTMLEQNSPVRLSEAEKEGRLQHLIKNIPFEKMQKGATWGDLFAHYGVIGKWAVEVSSVCPECINKELFDKQFAELKRSIHNEKLETDK